MSQYKPLLKDLVRTEMKNITTFVLNYKNQESHHELYWGEKKLVEMLAGEYEYPTYVYNLELITSRIKQLQFALGNKVQIFYALKANPYIPLVKQMSLLGVGADVVSAGEMRRALECGINPDKIIFSGVGKTKEELEFTLKLGVKQINVESVPELVRILTLAKQLNVKAPVALRLNPEVDAKTHPYIATGLKENKFGIEKESIVDCEKILKENLKNLEFMGFSAHIGSQILDLSVMDEAQKKLGLFVKDWASRGWKFKTIDVGGGLGIHYDREDFLGEFEQAKIWGSLIQENLSGLATEFLVEPGRWIVGHAGLLVARVEYVKRTIHKNFLILDTGMNHLMRPALYQAKHRLLPLKKSQEPEESYQVVGPICESSDVLLAQINLPRMQEGDLVALLDTGAYGASMASTYNLHELPKEILV